MTLQIAKWGVIAEPKIIGDLLSNERTEMIVPMMPVTNPIPTPDQLSQLIEKSHAARSIFMLVAKKGGLTAYALLRAEGDMMIGALREIGVFDNARVVGFFATGSETIHRGLQESDHNKQVGRLLFEIFKE